MRTLPVPSPSISIPYHRTDPPLLATPPEEFHEEMYFKQPEADLKETLASTVV
jgi:hypothetical protein